MKPLLNARQQRLRPAVINQDHRNIDRNPDDDHSDYGLDDSEAIYADDGGGPVPLDQLLK